MKTKVRKMMKVCVLLILPCVLCVPADIPHEDVNVVGCSDYDGENVFSLDGDKLWYADFNNKKGVYPQPDFIDRISYEKDSYDEALTNQKICISNLRNSRVGMKNIPEKLDPPCRPIIYIKDYLELGKKNTLICHVSGFYPAPVKIYWMKNFENVTEGTSITVPILNKDITFRQSSRLEFIPQQGDIYNCTVTHPATQPVTRLWDIESPQPGVGPAVFCGVGLTVGLLGVAAGTFFLIKGNECS